MQVEAIAAKAAEAKAGSATKAKKRSAVVARPLEVLTAASEQYKQLAHGIKLGLLTAPDTRQHNAQSVAEGEQLKAPQLKVLHAVLSLHAIFLTCHLQVSSAL